MKTRLRLMGEMFLLYGALPIAIALYAPTRLVLFSFLWGAGLLVLLYLRRKPLFSWRHLWVGYGWHKKLKSQALLLFFANLPILAGITLWYAPDRFLMFPLTRPLMWAAVMVLYPILSVLAQVLVFRVFFFDRYAPLFPKAWQAVFVCGVCFGVAHAAYGNWVAPVLSALGGMIMAAHYIHHRSLKWAVIEHAAYGCLIFTLGIGWYFFKH